MTSSQSRFLEKRGKYPLASYSRQKEKRGRRVDSIIESQFSHIHLLFGEGLLYQPSDDWEVLALVESGQDHRIRVLAASLLGHCEESY